MQQFLRATEIIDWQHPAVEAHVRTLRGDEMEPAEIARRCFEWVRDEIRHSGDHRLQPVTCTASDVLLTGSGFCYAKSHLLAALLRASGIPAGFCYQRLSQDGVGEPFCLHGLCAVHLPGVGWYRIDPRGNRPGIDAQFTPPREQLAFAITLRGEADLPEIWPEPLPVVVAALRAHTDAQVLANDLPDVAMTGGFLPTRR
jgi:transglutaminase-like putative cysteine protease